MTKQDIIQFLRDETLKAQSELATEFVQRVIEQSANAAALGYESVRITPAHGEIIVSQTHDIMIDLEKEVAFEHKSDFYITNPVNMNHVHADEKLRELGFKTQFKEARLSKISW